MSALAHRAGPADPHATRGPFTRWPRLSDAVLAVVVFGISLVSVAVSALGDGEGLTAATLGDRPLGAVVLLALAAVALYWRREHVVAVTAVELAIVTVWAVAGYGDGGDLVLVVVCYSVGRYCDDPRESLGAVAAVVAVSVLGTLVDPHQRVDVVPSFLFTVLPWYVGHRVRNRGDYLALLEERAVRLEAEQHARARRAVVEERARIARELHDVVAHQVSMMTVQAGAAKTVAREDLDAAIEAMGDVERAGRQALGELRHLLGVLRPDDAEPERLGPQPGLRDLPALVEELRHTGAEVSLAPTDLPEELPTAVDLSAYRIVQEAVTNVVKHAGREPVVTITVAVDGHALVIEVTNTTEAVDGSASPTLPGSGYGLTGMRERAVLLGGTMQAGSDANGRFRVTARLPLEQVAA